MKWLLLLFFFQAQQSFSQDVEKLLSLPTRETTKIARKRTKEIIKELKRSEPEITWGRVKKFSLKNCTYLFEDGDNCQFFYVYKSNHCCSYIQITFKFDKQGNIIDKKRVFVMVSHSKRDCPEIER